MLLNFVPVLFRSLFDLVVAVLIIMGVLQQIRKILLLDPMVREVVGVEIALLPFLPCTVGMDVLQLSGNVS